MGVPNFWEGQVENRAKCGKIVIFPGLKGEFFQLVPDPLGHQLYTNFLTKHTPSSL